MALIGVTTTEGETVLVHSSVFDHIGKRPAVATGSWNDVWARAEKLLTHAEAARLAGVSASTVYDRWFPKPFAISDKGQRLWRASEVSAWAEARQRPRRRQPYRKAPPQPVQSSDGMLTVAQVCQRVGLTSRGRILTLVREGKFPAPVIVGMSHKPSLWSAEAMDAWVMARLAKKAVKRRA